MNMIDKSGRARFSFRSASALLAEPKEDRGRRYTSSLPTASSDLGTVRRRFYPVFRDARLPARTATAEGSEDAKDGVAKSATKK